MPEYFAKPENALKRANEFIDVGKPERAMDVLSNVMKARRHRMLQQRVHEPIMMKLVELCVDLRRVHIAKEALHQFKNMTMQVNVKSLEDVVRFYLKLAQQKTDEAKREAKLALVDVDDLDVIQTPEMLLMTAVSGDDMQQRSDRAFLTPSVKFLWESYKQCLDLLRNNSKVERLYQDIAMMAFQFCSSFQRKTEFRKLCETLRSHLSQTKKAELSSSRQQFAIDLNNADSHAMHLETRLAQLNCAIEMELWQEAFRAIEDVHDLLSTSKKPPKPSLQATYYRKVGLVLLKSQCYVYHAAALHRLFALHKEQRKSPAADELQRLASHVVVATLAVPHTPVPLAESLIDESTTTSSGASALLGAADKQKRLATLLGYAVVPTRDSLVADLLGVGTNTSVASALQHCTEEPRRLAALLDGDCRCSPLRLSEEVEPLLRAICAHEELNTYVGSLRLATVFVTLRQLGTMYSAIRLDKLAVYLPFVTRFDLERAVVDAARNLRMRVRIDHAARCVRFVNTLSVLQLDAEYDAATLDASDAAPSAATMTSDVRTQLVRLANAVSRSSDLLGLSGPAQPAGTAAPNQPVSTLGTVTAGTSRTCTAAELLATAASGYHKFATREHKRMLERKTLIERRKEDLERIADLRMKREQERIEEEQRARERINAARSARQDRVTLDALAKAKRTEDAEKFNRIEGYLAKERIENVLRNRFGDLANKLLDTLTEEELNKNPTEWLERAVVQLERERQDQAERLRIQEKKIDHVVRAKRLEEIPLLEEAITRQRRVDREQFEVSERERIETARRDRQAAIETRKRLERTVGDKETFCAAIRARRVEEWQTEMDAFEERATKHRETVLVERRRERIADRKREYLDRMRHKRDAELDAVRRQRQEEERREREEKEEKLRRQAEMQRQRELEIEAKHQERESERERGGADRPAAGPADDRERDRDRERERERGSGGGWQPAGGSRWRQREQDRRDRWEPTTDRDRDRERGDRDRVDRERGDRDRVDRERGDRERGDRDRVDRERGDRDRVDRERGDRDRERSDRDRPRDSDRRRFDFDDPPARRNDTRRDFGGRDLRRDLDREPRREPDRDLPPSRRGDRDEQPEGGERSRYVPPAARNRDEDDWRSGRDDKSRRDDRRAPPPTRGTDDRRVESNWRA